MQPKTLIKDVLRTLRYPLWTVPTFFLEENNHVLSSTNKHALNKLLYKGKIMAILIYFPLSPLHNFRFCPGAPKAVHCRWKNKCMHIFLAQVWMVFAKMHQNITLMMTFFPFSLEIVPKFITFIHMWQWWWWWLDRTMFGKYFVFHNIFFW